jgi:hypothetical protein
MVHHFFVEKGSNHAHQPFFEIVGKGNGVVSDVYVGGKLCDVIGGSVPGWQALKILFKGVEGINKL